ncbi:hypothetical protein FKP32DRAFT_1199650 [Trametes sanguinea]|nr:hypothetical protein FKP32DRAFT_1199650 [Trametes sanguinea]
MSLESVTTYSVAAGLRRLAFAYRMTTVADAVYKLLDPTFPATIQGWDDRPANAVSFDLGKEQAIEAYNLCKFTRDRHLLAATYFCALLPEADLRKGTRRLDGTPEMLTADDLRAILDAKKLLKRLGAKALREAHKVRAVGCSECAKTHCQEAFLSGILPNGQDARELARGHIVSRWADKELDWAERWQTICERCVRHAGEEHLKLRKALWEQFADSVRHSAAEGVARLVG